jgi:thiamine biosynthesis lipoprotein
MLPLRGIRFRALGTQVKIISPALENGALQSLVADYESRFSRFRPNSELQQICRSAGRPTDVSADMFDVLSLAARFWRETGGVFDPLVRPQLEAAGYDRTFEDVPASAARPAPELATHRPRFGDVVLDARRRTVLLPEGASIDFGGIAKGWILDRLGDALRRHEHFLVDIGGDMVAGGNGPDGEPGWLISVADPYVTEFDLCWLRLHDQAIATSTTMRRRWQRDGRWMHHIIDPRTGAPAQSDLAQVTVVAPTAVGADVYAKTALILGAPTALPILRRRGLPALLVSSSGQLATPLWPRFETAMTA